MKKVLYSILILLTTIFMVGCTNNVKEENKETEAEHFSSLYEKVDKDNVYKRISAKDAVDMVKEGTGILYLGFNTCPWCKQVVGVLNDAAKEKNITSVYYIENFYNMRPDKNANPENKKEYNELLKLLDDVLPYEKDENGNDTDKKVIRVPLILFIQNGKIVSYHSGTYEGHELKTKIDENGKEVKYLEDLTEEQKNQIKEELKQDIEKVYNKTCNTGC